MLVPDTRRLQRFLKSTGQSWLDIMGETYTFYTSTGSFRCEGHWTPDSISKAKMSIQKYSLFLFHNHHSLKALCSVVLHNDSPLSCATASLRITHQFINGVHQSFEILIICIETNDEVVTVNCPNMNIIWGLKVTEGPIVLSYSSCIKDTVDVLI